MSNTVRLNTKLIKSIGDVLYMPAAELIEATTIANSTWYNIMAKPEGISIQQLILIANGLHIPARRFFSTGSTDLVGKRDDYVTDPYLPCRYDEAALQRLVERRTDATWKKAAEAAGMSWQRLRNSLLAVTRTPVTRFLAVCKAFDVDPFAVLIDDNPPKKQSRTGGSAAKAASETAYLRRRIDELTAIVDDLKGKYESLLLAHEQLARRVQVNIGTINGSNIGIAADAVDPR